MINSGSISHEKTLAEPVIEAAPFLRKSLSSTSMQILVHILAWLLFVSLTLTFHMFSSPFGRERIPLPFIYKSSILFILNIALFYFNAHYAIPRLLFKKKILKFSAVVLLTILTVQFANYWLSGYLKLEDRIRREFRMDELRNRAMPTAPPFPVRIPMKNHGPRFLDVFAWLSTLIILGVSTSLTVTMKWFRDAENQKNLEKERLSSELSHLKSQINPHFFFNTLNNIYALTETNPRDAQEAIYTLSKMMRYMLYETEHHQVLLSKEIEFMNHYIELMRLRLTDSVSVQFDHPTDVGIITIAPLLFISFIENAFKHGVSYHEKSYVVARLSVETTSLQFEVKNRLLRNTKTKSLEESGIGLVNVRRRLQLLYPQKHQLQITASQDEYIVHLTIQL